MKLRSLIDASTRILGKLKRHQRKQINAPIVKLNLGCGLAVYGDWINIDGSLNALIAGWPRFMHKFMYSKTGANHYYSQEEYCRLLGEHKFIHHDLSYGIPLYDQSTDFVYSSHFLEHLYRSDAEHMLKESLRVLKPGGVLRLCVPDLEYAVSLYARGDKEAMLSNYFFVEDDNSYYARHKYMYDFQMLEVILRKVGFQDVQRCAYREGLTPDILNIDNRPEDTLFIEARKSKLQ
jgi:SAM-dependent methyltransferase